MKYYLLSAMKIQSILLLVILIYTNCAKSSNNMDKSAETSARSSAPLGKVLFVAAVGSKSHKNFYYAIIEALSDAGYEITLLTPYPPAKTIKNVREIVLESNDITPHMPNSFTDTTLNRFKKIMNFGADLCLNALRSDVYSEALNEKFDIAFISMFFNDCFLGHINSWNIPFVLVTAAELNGLISSTLIGSPKFPSFDYNPMLGFPQPMSFVHRFIFTTTEVMKAGMMNYIYYRVDSAARSEELLPTDTPYLPSIYANASLMIANSFRMVEHPRPYMPNILLAGGIHLKPPKPLAKDLEDWVQSSGDAGFIFFSLGSAVRASDIPLETIKVLLSVFKSLKQNVLWKFNMPDVGSELPPNVRLTTWAPQQDLLGHPKVRLFITHGGLLSTQEATYHGVPVLGIPVYGDQVGNMNQAESQGWGLKLTWDEITYDRFKSAILNLTDNFTARQTVSRIGKLMQDQPTNPADDVVWWTGYILRTGGARHLKSGALPLTWYELYNVDVWAAVVLILLLLLWVDYKIMRAFCRLFCSKSTKPISKKCKQQ